jgi:dihydroflavonol-4-reductase
MILVTGGTGFVGSHMLAKIVEENRPVKAFHRPHSDFSELKKVFQRHFGEAWEARFNTITWYCGNLSNPVDIAGFIGEGDIVFHCAGTIRFDKKGIDSLYRNNVRATELLVNESLEKQVAYFSHLSSVAAFGEWPEGSLINEHSAFNGRRKDSHYFYSKFQSEMEVWRGFEEGLKGSIVNPGVILGSGFWRTGSNQIIRATAKGIPFYPDGIGSFVSVEDVTSIMWELFTRGIHGERYILVSDNQPHVDFLTLLCSELGVKPPKKQLGRISYFIMRYLLGPGISLLGKPNPFPPSFIRGMKSKTRFEAHKIEDLLGRKLKGIDRFIPEIASVYKKEEMELKA